MSLASAELLQHEPEYGEPEAYSEECLLLSCRGCDWKPVYKQRYWGDNTEAWKQYVEHIETL